MKTIPTTEQIAHQLESLARRIAPTIALVITAVILTYNAGYQLGRAIHQANDWLAHRWPTRPASTSAPQPAPAPLQQIIRTTDTVVLLTQAEEIEQARALRAQGLTQRAIALRMGVSRTTVRRRLAAAM
jgi:DNA-binding NarL/FixJ family response regulator